MVGVAEPARIEWTVERDAEKKDRGDLMGSLWSLLLKSLPHDKEGTL